MADYPSDLYAAYRPKYPRELIKYISDFCKVHTLAWDCATGTGIVANLLSEIFSHVIASDCSASQLAQAIQRPNIVYRHEDVLETSLDIYSVDLVTIAQAVHWLDTQSFLKKVDKILKPEGILAVWCYEKCLNPQVEKLTQEYLDLIVNAKEKKILTTMAQKLEIEHSNFVFVEPLDKYFIQQNFSMMAYLGYLQSISATQRYINEHHISPITYIYNKALDIWGDEKKILNLVWPIHLQILKKKNYV